MIFKTFPSFLWVTLFLFIISCQFTIARSLADFKEPRFDTHGHPSAPAHVARHFLPPGNMESMKAEKPVASQPFQQVKKGNTAKMNDSGSKGPTSNATPRNSQKAKRKVKAGKPTGKQ